ncbi:uncharacterized protein TrAtP1_003780 [Trichoderma atroviride]|uniref:uncharacterized protein n=1 Tax=Hypocrea atroviridis TaxID=63577 RepID=UPI00331B83BD|nr:hypothetical protein TrAtP1_003780 [Trichoderma atroviride]
MERLYIIGCLNKIVASLRLYAAITLIFHRLRILRAYLVIPTQPVIRRETPHLLQMSWLCRNPEPDASDRGLLKFSQGQSEAFSIRKDEDGCDTETTRVLESKTSSTEAIVYTCRTAESWDDDMALTVTFLPETMTTNALWFGCNLKERDVHGHLLTDSAIITGKLRNFDG